MRSLSRRTLQRLSAALENAADCGHCDCTELKVAVDGLLRVSPKRRAAATVRRKEKTAVRWRKGAATAVIRAAVMERASLICECGCGRWFRAFDLDATPTLDHFAGRARRESVESCWMLRADCHRARTDNSPSAEVWLEKFIAHCVRHGYLDEQRQAENRFAFVTARKQVGT